MAWASDQFVSLADLYVAYRKAKIDSFYERDQAQALEFAEYERHLDANLRSLLVTINEPEPRWMTRRAFVGGYSYQTKSLAPTSPATPRRRTPFINADPTDAWEALAAETPHTAAFRLVGVHPIPFHVVSALWIQKVGYVYDAILKREAYASRVRMRRTEHGTSLAPSDTAMGSFKPYQYGYRDWRQDGLAAARHALRDDKRIVVVTADLRRFYHETSPDFLLEPGFLTMFALQLSADQRLFTRQLLTAIRTWAKQTPEHGASPRRGLPVGLSASRLISNVVMAGFDRFITEGLEPIHYGRYVDDVMLVLDNRHGFASAPAVWDWISAQSNGLIFVTEEGGEPAYQLRLPYSRGSHLRFSGEKQKVFALQGDPGLALLASITKTLAERSSDWRLLPDLPEHPGSLVTDFVIAGDDGTEEVDNLRKADGLSVRRLAFALRLRNLEAVERDVPPAGWERHRLSFFRTVLDSVITVPGLFDFGSYFPRLIGLAVASGDWTYAKAFVQKIGRAFERAAATTITDERQLQACRSTLIHSCYEAALAAATRVRPEDAAFADLLAHLTSQQSEPPSPAQALELGHELYSADLAREPFRDAWLDSEPFAPIARAAASIDLPDDARSRLLVDDTRDFALQCDLGWSQRLLRALVLPTRPLTISEITLMDQASLIDPRRLQRWIRALRGSELRPPRVSSASSMDPWAIEIPHFSRTDCPLVALPCIETKDASWLANVQGTTEPDSDRYFRINRIVNEVIRTKPPVQYLVMPELSLPRKWFNRLAHKLAHSDISLVAGLEYYHYGPSLVSNQVRASLVTNQFGFIAPVMYLQEKERAALHEATELQRKGSKALQPVMPPKKPILKHGAFHFAILICSELTNVQFRASLRGKVDALIVPEWNPDTNSFASFVESSALDIHCYVVQVNNRLYGDTRVRAPYRDLHKRDVARIKGGECDYVVVARLDVPALRAFQAVAPSPTDGQFKPVPDGFEIHPSRIPQPIEF